MSLRNFEGKLKRSVASRADARTHRQADCIARNGVAAMGGGRAVKILVIARWRTFTHREDSREPKSSMLTEHIVVVVTRSHSYTDLSKGESPRRKRRSRSPSSRIHPPYQVLLLVTRACRVDPIVHRPRATISVETRTGVLIQRHGRGRLSASVDALPPPPPSSSGSSSSVASSSIRR